MAWNKVSPLHIFRNGSIARAPPLAAVSRRRRANLEERRRHALGGAMLRRRMMKKAFVSIVSSYVGYCIASVLRRQGYDVVGSIRAEGEECVYLVYHCSRNFLTKEF